MKNELKHMIINYTKSDIDYIEELTSFISNQTDEILSFFNIDKLDKKINVILYDDLTEFRKKCKYYYQRDIPDWLCGLTLNNEIIVLSLCEYVKTKSHERGNLNDIKYLILHEFVHSVTRYVSPNMHVAWLSEGLACSISHQYKNCDMDFNVTLDEMINGTTNYKAYYTMFNYVLNTYGKEYIFKLLNNVDYLKEETSRLYEEVKTFMNNSKII